MGLLLLFDNILLAVVFKHFHARPVLLVALILELYDHAKDYRDAPVRKLSGEEGADAPLFEVEGRHAGTLRDFAGERLAEIERALSERGHRGITETWEELCATLRPAGLKVECSSELRGKAVRRSYYFYEAEGGEKILIESTDAEA